MRPCCGSMLWGPFNNLKQADLLLVSLPVKLSLKVQESQNMYETVLQMTMQRKGGGVKRSN